MRAFLLLSVSVLGPACGGEAPVGERSQPAAAGGASRPASGSDEPIAAAAPSPVPVAEAIAEVEAAAAAGEPERAELAEPATEPAEPAEPADPLAPILPSGPEPGSPEADAELDALLEESTLTQAEFEAAFKGSKPSIEGDQFKFGDRTRKAPKVTIGTPKVSGSKLAASEALKLAEADRRALEGCLAVALADDPSTRGSITLTAVFDADGAASEVSSEGGASLGAPLRGCLAAVADDWTLAAAAGATIAVPLQLAGE